MLVHILPTCDADQSHVVMVDRPNQGRLLPNLLQSLAPGIILAVCFRDTFPPPQPAPITDSHKQSLCSYRHAAISCFPDPLCASNVTASTLTDKCCLITARFPSCQAHIQLWHAPCSRCNHACLPVWHCRDYKLITTAGISRV